MKQKKSPDEIRIFNLKYSPAFVQEFQEGVARILSEGFLTNHRHVKEFEVQFGRFVGVEDCVAVHSGTSALEIVLRSLNLRGKKVIVPTNTFIATASAIINSGGVPLVCDVNLNGHLDIDEIRKQNPASVGAVIAVHIGGLIDLSIYQIKEWCEKHGVFLLEDCAHSHGSSIEGFAAGLIGDAGAYSFHLTKTMTSGEGGAIVSRHTSNLNLYRRYRQFGVCENEPLLHEFVSSNYKMSEFQGLMGCMELKRSSERINRRREIQQLYRDRLKNSQSFEVLDPSIAGTSGFYKTIVKSKIEKKYVAQALVKENIALTGSVYEYPLHQQPVMRAYVGDQKFPRADHFAKYHFCPPCYPELTNQDVYRVTDTLLQLCEKRSNEVSI